MSSDSGSAENGTTNFIEDWGPDPWGLDLALHGSDDPPLTNVELLLQQAENGVLLGVFRGDTSA